MKLDIALKGFFDAEDQLRTPGGVANPTIMSENMMRLSQYTGILEEHLAELEKYFEINYASELKYRMVDEHMKVTQAERLVDIDTAETKGQIKYLTRLVGSAWKQTGIIQSRINHLVKQSETTNL